MNIACWTFFTASLIALIGLEFVKNLENSDSIKLGLLIFCGIFVTISMILRTMIDSNIEDKMTRLSGRMDKISKVLEFSNNEKIII